MCKDTFDLSVTSSTLAAIGSNYLLWEDDVITESAQMLKSSCKVWFGLVWASR